MKRVTALQLVTCVLVVLLLAACGSSAPLPASPTTAGSSTSTVASPAAAPTPVPTVQAVEPAAGAGRTPVKIAVFGTIAEAPIYVATERGYFAENGISPVFVSFDTSARVIPALATGQIDVASASLSSGLFNAVDRGVGIKLVAAQSVNSTCAHSSSWLLVRKDLADSGAIRTAADLRGRKIAVSSKAGTLEYVLDTLLRQGGLQPTDVQIVEMGFGDMGAAFGGHAIDAAFGAEPTATSYVDKGLATKWLCGADIIPDMQITYIQYSSQFANQHTDLAQRWMAAYRHGASDWQAMLDTGAGKEANFAALAKYSAIKDPTLLQRISLPLLPPDGQIDLANVQAQIMWAHQRGYITHEPSPAAFVDTRFVAQATR
ncbi:MAG: ABC transporter substrate-binding protein [Thermomicrobiales bacterium]